MFQSLSYLASFFFENMLYALLMISLEKENIQNNLENLKN